MSFTDQRRWVVTERDVATRWSDKMGLYCHLCNHKLKVGEGCRWVYANGPKEEGVYSYGNFFCCDECDGPDVLERYQEACTLLHQSMTGHDEAHWPVDLAAKLIRLRTEVRA